MPFVSYFIFLALLLGKAHADLNWAYQSLGQPYVGENTGVKIYDINHDGFPDLLFSSGRHAIDQSHALINLGPIQNGAHANQTGNAFLWSRPLPLGDPGGYYQVDVAPLSTLKEGHLAVLLAGGSCTRQEYCTPGTLTPAVLIDAQFSGCSAQDPNPDPASCTVEWKTLWTETPATGNRNGALSSLLGEEGKPAIILVGGGNLTVTQWDDTISGYPTTPNYALSAEDMVQDEKNYIHRSSGLAVGIVGSKKAIVLGPQSTGSLAPAPVVVVYQEPDGTYTHFHVRNDNNANTTTPGYKGDPRYDVQPTGIALADIDGNGAVDIIPANFLSPRLIKENYPLIQPVLLVDEDPRDDTPLRETPVFGTYMPPRVVAAANIFQDSPYPDLIYGLVSGDILLFANLGRNATSGEFMGFEFRQVLTGINQASCTIRDLQVASLAPCTMSIVAATICHGDESVSGNAMFTAHLPHHESCVRNGGGGGDPHIMRWDRERASFHGECDLVMVHSETFHGGVGFDLHARSTIESHFSYFETGAVRFGNTTVEFYRNRFYVDGKEYGLTDLPFTLEKDGNTYSIVEESRHTSTRTTYLLKLGPKSQVKIRFYKKFANIDILGHPHDFSDSVGLLGDYYSGDMIGRNGQRMTDFEQFGFEWQVQPEDPRLFRVARSPQLPYERCRMPTAARPSRHLRATSPLISEAKEACAHLPKQNDFRLCVDDVVATGDVGLADIW